MRYKNAWIVSILEVDHEAWSIHTSYGKIYEIHKIETDDIFNPDFKLTTPIEPGELIALYDTVKSFVEDNRNKRYVDFIPGILHKQIRETNLNSLV